MRRRRNEALDELTQEIRSAGPMSARFPAVTSIVVRMNYSRGRTSALLRTVNFLPASPAFFRISCLGEGCERGGLDLTRIIGDMVRRKERSSQGAVHCVNHDPEILHADVAYDVAITYA